jgi:hypothetical protein
LPKGLYQIVRVIVIVSMETQQIMKNNFVFAIQNKHLRLDWDVSANHVENQLSC